MTDASRLSRRDLARLITGIENGDAAARERAIKLRAPAERAHIVGVTGAPGGGKSTLVAALARCARTRGRRVGILTIDPSSPFTGGAILGDRIRMRELSGDDDVFIRSMATRGAVGGLAAAAVDVAAVLAAAGFGFILVETVGAGQADLDVTRVADTVIVVEAPGMGDDVQAIKAGILEIADVLVVNKADRNGAENTVAALKAALGLGEATGGHHGMGARPAQQQHADGSHANAWRILILKTVAQGGGGVTELLDAIDRHAAWLTTSGEGERRRRRRAEADVLARVRDLAYQHALNMIPRDYLQSVIDACAARQLDPAEAARALMNYKMSGVSETPEV